MNPLPRNACIRENIDDRLPPFPLELPSVHHRPAPRGLPRLLWSSGAADAAYRFDCRARHGVRPVLRRKSGLHAQSREPDDRTHAVGPWRAVERHSAIDEFGDLRRAAARRRLPHGVDRQEPPAEFHVLAAARETGAGARGLSRAVRRPDPGASQRPRRPDLRAGNARLLDCEGRNGSNAVLRLRSRHPGACAW